MWGNVLWNCYCLYCVTHMLVTHMLVQIFRYSTVRR